VGATPFDFRIEVERIGDRAVLVIAGDVDLATAPIVINKVESLFREPIASIAVDLGAVTFVDSSGIAALLKAHTLAMERCVPFAFASLSLEVRHIIRSTGLADVFGLESQGGASV
jgi:anti-sigma B factor antagonist